MRDDLSAVRASIAEDLVASADCGVLRLRGDFDDDTHVVTFRQAVAALASQVAPRSVVIDLTDVSHLGDRGLGELVRARVHNARVVLRGAGPHIVRLIEEAHLGGVFDLVDCDRSPARA